MVEKKRFDLFFNTEKKGQVTIFIIIAVIIIGLALLIYFLVSSSDSEITSGFNEQNPSGFLQACLEPSIQETIELISLQGGSLDPELSILYQGNPIEYLCYTGEYYVTCVVQQPLLKPHIESEIENEIRPSVADCFNQLQQNYRERGYNVDLTPGTTKVELLPKRVITTMNYILTVTKGETQRYDSFNVILNNNLYELTSIANSIVEWETKYGNAESTVYMTYYKDLKVEKLKQTDGSTIYILTDRNTESNFQFAVRSLAWPPGFGIEGVAA